MKGKFAIAVVLASFALVTVGVGLRIWVGQRHQRLESYNNVAFSDGKAEVQYKLGTPSRVTGSVETSGANKGFAPMFDVAGDPASDKSALPIGTDFRTYDTWDYDNPSDKGGYISIRFGKRGFANEIECYSFSGSKNSCEPALGIKIGDTENFVRGKLGKPSNERFDGPSKLALYQPLNLELFYARERVYLIGVGLFEKNQN